MIILVDITNRTKLKRLLLSLKPDTTPLWGKMKPQQMVEHLIVQVQYTNGKLIPYCERPADEAYKAKQEMIYTDAEIPQNIVLETLPENFIYTDIPTAVQQLIIELDTFDAYFKKPGTMAIHGGFGPMKYQEWINWHGKHFIHHFKQFGLLR